MARYLLSRKLKKYLFIGDEKKFVIPHLQSFIPIISDSLQNLALRIALSLS